MFTDAKSGIKIYADLDSSVSHATLRPCDIIPRLLDVIKDTPEYAQIIASNHSHDLNVIFDPTPHNDNDKRWESDDVSFFLNETLFDILNSYAPNGYIFCSHPGDASDFGYWNCEMLS